MVELQAFYDKVVTYNIRSLSLCQSKDLLGIVTDDDTVIIKRISHQPKKVVSIDETCKITAMCFKPDGEGIALGSEDGSIKIYTLSSTSLQMCGDLDLHKTGRKLKNLESEGKEHIQSIQWYQISQRVLEKKHTISDYISTVGLVKEKFSGLSIVLSLDANDQVSFIVNGMCPLAIFNPINESKALSVIINGKHDSMILLSQNIEGYFLEIYDISVIHKKSTQIQETAEIFSYCQELFKNLSRGTKEIIKEANSVCNSFVGRYLAGIEDCLKKAGNNSSVNELLSQCAGTGVISPCLSKFIKEEMQNTKTITQYEEKIAIQVKNSQITLLQDCRNTAIGLIFFLNTFINQARSPLYAPFGLDASILKDLVLKLNSFVLKINNTMALLSEAHSNIKNTIHWLHNWNIKLVKEDEQAEAPEEWAVNLKQLINYLQNPQSLYFEKLYSYLKTSLPSHFQEMIDSWSLFSSKLPTNFAKYFFINSKQKLIDYEYENQSMHIDDDRVIVGLFCSSICDIFIHTNNQVTSYRITPGIATKHLGYFSKGIKVLIGGTMSGYSQIAAADSSGIASVLAKYPGEEITAFACSANRAIACLVTNERTLRLYDLEEV